VDDLDASTLFEKLILVLAWNFFQRDHRQGAPGSYRRPGNTNHHAWDISKYYYPPAGRLAFFGRLTIVLHCESYHRRPVQVNVTPPVVKDVNDDNTFGSSKRSIDMKHQNLDVMFAVGRMRCAPGERYGESSGREKNFLKFHIPSVWGLISACRFTAEASLYFGKTPDCFRRLRD
jgi:hypothetical protein